MEALDHLGTRLNVLLKKHVALEAENKKLKETIARQLKTEEQLNKKLASLEQGMVSVRIGGKGTKEDQENMRQQLDSLISEIDGILNTLND